MKFTTCYLLKRIVAGQLRSHLSLHYVLQPLKSVFSPAHSTETELVKVSNDILCSCDQGSLCLLVNLDFSAAFDTVNHAILLHLLSSFIYLSGIALIWFKSYLTNHLHFISASRFSSRPRPVTCGVPQVSTLDHLLFLIYMLPLDDVNHRHGVNLHIYLDETQIYFAFSSTNSRSASVLSVCLADIKAWMSVNFLQLNVDKVEAILLGSRQHLHSCRSKLLNLPGLSLRLTEPERNFGVRFDSQLSFLPHIRSLTRSIFFHLCHIAHLRPYLILNATEILVHAIVTSRLDYSNTLLTGLPSSTIHKTQLIQNSAARILTQTKLHIHISPVLARLHWLPITERIDFKILTLAFKSIHSLAPAYLSSPQSTIHRLRSTGTNLLLIPHTPHPTIGGCAFSNYAPKLWNTVPQTLHLAPSLPFFKSR
uniref:Reverse transcriptase domain-containing protein n=1 Tax=Callorhinchus milii TaxID=7868 RepID=A0A4W3K4W7_CALMI